MPSEFELFAILIVSIAVITTVVFLLLRRMIKIKEQKQKLKEQLQLTTSEPLILHRCKNPECRKIFEKPVYMIEYAPPPKRMYSACPHCRIILEEVEREKESEPEKIPSLRTEKMEEKEGLKHFTLIIDSSLLHLKKMMAVLDSYKIVPAIQEKDKMFVLSFSSETNYDFSNLKNLGWIKEVKVE